MPPRTSAFSASRTSRWVGVGPPGRGWPGHRGPPPAGRGRCRVESQRLHLPLGGPLEEEGRADPGSRTPGRGPD
eukprot:7185642-Lingulodinium_polyedra.AAC.1